MVHILGISLPDSQLARFALTSIYGIGHHTSHRLCARFQIHDRCKVKDLTPFQITAIASFLSSPKTAPPVPHYPLATPDFTPRPAKMSSHELQAEFNAAQATQRQRKQEKLLALGKALPDAKAESKTRDPLNNLKIESELRREVRENIAHQRMIGSYVGRRHAMNLPVRGQNTQSNAKTAKKLNRLNRYG
ncbi:S13-like H2TH domain-containing protein [Dendrothele bispora CBS 962.96]|uniref:S13-like H2TH domain-containing protein n=1 Tax=Dendrothele bispora (strain CBS 962.96) TaxID=1314807 RepID=A0A4S8LE41_DENBC|nr:S13-like H2TH domain-containing protein [Dendrothele bispora CBS 962.96]